MNWRRDCCTVGQIQARGTLSRLLVQCEPLCHSTSTTPTVLRRGNDPLAGLRVRRPANQWKHGVTAERLRVLTALVKIDVVYAFAHTNSDGHPTPLVGRAARCVQVAGCSLVVVQPRCALVVLGLVCWTCLWHSSWSAERRISTSSSGQCGAADSPCAPPERVPSRARID